MMTILQSIQLFVALNLLIIGLSHFFQSRIWVRFFQYLYGMGQTGNIINAMIALSMGSIIVSFHQVWSWPFLLVTVYGILLLIKAAVYLIAPDIGMKSIGKVNDQYYSKFKTAGLIMIALSIFLFVKLAQNLQL